MGHYQALSVRYAIAVNALEQGASSLPISPNACTLSALWQLARLVTFPTGRVSEEKPRRLKALCMCTTYTYGYSIIMRTKMRDGGPRLGNQRGVDEIALSHLRTNAARPYHGRHICRKGTPSALLV
jgi:hypothetical protein